MPIITVNELDLPPEQRNLSEHLKALGPEYKVYVEFRKGGAWVEKAIETVTIFVQNHGEAVAAVAGYVAKAVGDAAIDWAKQHFKQYPENRRPKKIVIYGPDRRPVRTVLVKDDEVSEE